MWISFRLQAEEYKNFEEIKNIREDGTEFWYARELSKVLQYKKWENFAKVIDRAKLACQNSGFEIDDHFPEVRKMVEIGSNTTRELLDYELSRYGCYLIVQNGNPRKEVIALGQTYFALHKQKLNWKEKKWKNEEKLILKTQNKIAQTLELSTHNINKIFKQLIKLNILGKVKNGKYILLI